MKSRALPFALWLLLAAAACAPPAPPRREPPRQEPRLEVLALNGGGNASGNYLSHLLHVEQLLGLLRRAGLDSGEISVLNADGEAPTLDLAARRESAGRGFWRLRGTRLERSLRPPVTFENTAIDVPLRAATKDDLRAWFEEAAGRLRAGDTLLLYVTDHGTKNDADTANNRITLWGKDETLSVADLRGMLALLDPGVRVVSLMSQCFSGSFAGLASDKDRRAGSFCGYFSSTADRPAYGCYPENRGRENVGHSFLFLDALGRNGSFARVHEETLVADQTPDVPLTTSDRFLSDRLAGAAREKGTELPALIDELLAEAWRDKAAWEPEIRLLDRIGQGFGLFSPRSFAELDAQARELPEVAGHLKKQAKAWKDALGDLNQANLERFVAARPEWSKRLADDEVRRLAPAAAREIRAELLGELASFTKADAAAAKRLALLRDRSESASAAAYRMEVREAVVLRMRVILTSIAARMHLATRGTAADRSAYEALRSCESFSLPAAGPGETGLAPRERFPPYDEDCRRAQASLPAWMGIQFRAADAELRRSLGLPSGAAHVLAVYPDSPAKDAGLEPGDLVLGPPDAPFQEPQQVREWVMVAKIGEPTRLAVLRDGARRELELVPGPFPMKWPDLPSPPKIGEAAPALVELEPHRGKLPRELAGGGSHLLFFWATWCGPCKQSLPELLDFERERGVSVVAVTDEPAGQIDAFLRKHGASFPETIARDEKRRTFLRYGVSGTPTFVLVDGEGKVRHVSSGYSREKGLRVEGWEWAGRTAKGK